MHWTPQSTNYKICKPQTSPNIKFSDFGVLVKTQIQSENFTSSIVPLSTSTWKSSDLKLNSLKTRFLSLMKTPVMDIEETKRNNIKVFFTFNVSDTFPKYSKKKKERGEVVKFEELKCGREKERWISKVNGEERGKRRALSLKNWRKIDQIVQFFFFIWNVR